MRILFIAPDRLTDCVAATAVLGWMQDNLPTPHFTVVCGPDAAPILAAAPGVERLIPVAEAPWAAHWWTIWKQVAGTGWRALVDLRGSLIGQTLVARRRLVLRASGGSAHRAAHLASVLRLNFVPAPRAFIPPARAAAASRLIPEGGPVLGLAPGAGAPERRWPAERFGALAALLTAPGGILAGGRVAAFGRAAEAPLVQAALAPVAATHRLPLVDLADAALLQACLARCTLVVGNDSAPLHLAAAAGVPTLGLYGPTRDDKLAPWSDKGASVRTPESAGGPDQAGAGARPMAGLDVERAAEAAATLWRDLGH